MVSQETIEAEEQDSEIMGTTDLHHLVFASISFHSAAALIHIVKDAAIKKDRTGKQYSKGMINKREQE